MDPRRRRLAQQRLQDGIGPRQVPKRGPRQPRGARGDGGIGGGGRVLEHPPLLQHPVQHLGRQPARVALGTGVAVGSAVGAGHRLSLPGGGAGTILALSPARARGPEPEVPMHRPRQPNRVRPRPAARRPPRPGRGRRTPPPAEAEAAPMPKELGGRKGPEPVRYGDWERKGIAVDF
jgi:hypothetical protein